MRSDAGEWRRERRHLNAHRHALAALAQDLYPDLARVAGTPLLCRPEWIAASPIGLADVVLSWRPDAPAPACSGAEPEAGAVRAGYATYAEAVRAIDPPRLFENRVAYRLLEVSMADGHMAYGEAAYFDGVNVGEAAAHEFARAARDGRRPAMAELPFRARVGDPAGLARRAVLPAVSMLTLRRDAGRGEMTFVLHWRDPASVAHGGGMYQVMPVGVFQPADDAPASRRRDLDLWRCAVREYSEEFLGAGEDYGAGFAYETWPFHTTLTRARDEGMLRCYLLGMGVDPLTFATDLLAVTVIDSRVYDRAFDRMVGANAEGRVLSGGARGFRFDAETVARLTTREPMQAAGAAVLALAWRHRDVLRG